MSLTPCVNGQKTPIRCELGIKTPVNLGFHPYLAKPKTPEQVEHDVVEVVSGSGHGEMATDMRETQVGVTHGGYFDRWAQTIVVVRSLTMVTVAHRCKLTQWARSVGLSRLHSMVTVTHQGKLTPWARLVAVLRSLWPVCVAYRGKLTIYELERKS